MSFVNYPQPNLPLTGTELFMIAQYQNGQLVTCTSNVSNVIVSQITPSAFAASMLIWLNSLPTTLPATSGVAWLNGGVLQLS